MGPKNRNPRSQPSKPPQPGKPATAHGGVVDLTGGGAPPPLPQENDPLDPTSAIYSSIREECRKAIALLKQNKHSKVLRKTIEISENHPNSALAQCAQAYVHQQTAYVMAAPQKQRHLRAAVESARRAAAMSPNSIGFAAFYASLLFQTSNREEAVRECDRALSIVDPIDPALEKLADETESGYEKSTKEARIKRFKKNLRSLSQTFEGSTLIPPPVVEPPDDKAVEEMTGKLLAQQAAQGILRAHSELIPSPPETDEGQGVVDVNNPQNLKVQKHYQKVLLDRVVNSAKKVTDSKLYWASLSEEEKKELFQLSIEDLRKHLDSVKDGGRLAAKIWSEAIGFAQKNNTWKAFSCFFCDEWFIDLELLLNHIKEKHERVTAHDFLQFIPQEEADASRFELLDIKKQIVFTSDSSCLLLDDCFRDEEAGVEEPADSDALLHWVYDGFTIKEELEKWGAQHVGAKRNGEEAFQMFEKQYGYYQRLSEAMLGVDSKKGGLYALKVLCDKELEKRAEGDIRESYASLFRTMQQELELYSANPTTTIASPLIKKSILGPVSDAMPDVLKDAEALNENQPDACIRLAIERQIEKKSAELSKLEEMIRKTGHLLREAGTIYKQASSIDYRTIMLPFMKSFIQSKLEPLVFEAAKQKADTILSQLEASQGGSPVKPPKGDPKGKQQKKGKKKAKDDKGEAKDSKERKLPEELAHQKTVEDDIKRKALAKQNKYAATLTPEKMDKAVVVWPTARDDEGPDGSDVVQEERKLQEELARQKMVEDEAKRKAVAKQTKGSATPTPKEMSKKVVVRSPASEDEGPDDSIGKDVAASHHQVPPSVPTERVDQHDASQGTLKAQKNPTLPMIPEVEEKDLGVLSTIDRGKAKNPKSILKQQSESKSCRDSSSDEKKEELLQFRLRDLEEHLGSLKDGAGFTAKIFSEAIRFAQNNKTWKVFACSFCKEEKFVDLNSLLNHLQMVHESFSAHEFLHFVPQEEEADADVSEFELLDIKKRIVFSSDQSCLILDDHFLDDEEDDEQKPADSNALMHWLYGGSTIEEELEILWGGGHDEAKQKAKEAFEMFEHQYAIYQDMCEERLGLENKKEALKIQEANALNENKSDEVQREIEWAFETEIERQSAKLSDLEKMITKIDKSLRAVGKTYKQESSIDYRAIMLPFLKSFMQSKLEPLVYEDAKRKADAAGEAHFPTIAVTADELKLQIERKEAKKAAANRKLEDMLQNQQWIKDGAKKASATILEKMVKTVLDRSRASKDKYQNV